MSNYVENNDYIVDERDGEIILHKVTAGLQKLYLEPTSRCNLKCITCARQQRPEMTEGDLHMDLLEKLLQQLKAFPALKRIHLGGFGEPLAHPHRRLKKITCFGAR